jgi:putative transposase
LDYQKSSGDVRSLIPKYTQKGRSNLKSPITEELWQYGKDQYLKMERKSMRRAHDIMQAYAKDKKQLEYCMSYSTFRRRLKSLNLKEVMKKRIGERNTDKLFELSESQFPHGDYALQSVQIDHTPIDVLVVDEEYRLVTEKPYLTVAFDSHTRCVLGYYVTYDSPSRLSIAMTLINCISGKADSLKKVKEVFPDLDQKKLKILESSEWADVYGLPYTLHMDNGSDFTSDDIKLFGFAYQIHLHYRAVGKAQHGAYVERYLGTLNNRLHSIAGTTYSNVQERRNYPSEKRATYTIDELEARIISEIVLYHEEFHSEIKTTPLAKWKESFSIQNSERSINRNLGNVDKKRFKFDILPSETRTVQKGGVQIFGLKYSNRKIEKWVGVKDPNDARKSRRFRIRYDPRDIRTIFFYEDTKSEFIILKCINKMVSRYFRDKCLSLWDWKTINADLIMKGKRDENVDTF